jgi:PqqD family protein of HPr-rel-A system
LAKVYGLNSAVRLHWATFDDEVVAFDETSGQTHQLDTLRAFVLNALSEIPQTIDLLFAQIVEVMPLEYPDDMLRLLANILNEFEAHGLIRGQVP